MTHNHEAQPAVAAGLPLAEAKAVVIAVHGRGAGARDILSLADAIGQDGFSYLAPQATHNTWYPQSFLAPIEQNEPGLSSALNTLNNLVEHVKEQGIGTENVIFMGFSQGACLATEFVARNAQRFGGVIGYSGGLIGPPGTGRDYDGSLDGTPVFLGCSDVDFHIPLERVKETTEVLGALGGIVDERIYPGMGHTVNDDELQAGRAMLQALLQES